MGAFSRPGRTQTGSGIFPDPCSGFVPRVIRQNRHTQGPGAIPGSPRSPEYTPPCTGRRGHGSTGRFRHALSSDIRPAGSPGHGFPFAICPRACRQQCRAADARPFRARDTQPRQIEGRVNRQDIRFSRMFRMQCAFPHGGDFSLTGLYAGDITLSSDTLKEIVRHEKNLSAQQNQQKAYPRFPCPHEHSQRSRPDQPQTCQRPQEPVRLVWLFRHSPEGSLSAKQAGPHATEIPWPSCFVKKRLFMPGTRVAPCRLPGPARAD